MIALEVVSHAGKYINLQEQFFCEVYYSQKRDCFQKLSWRFDIRHSRNKQSRSFTQLSEAHVSLKLCIYRKKCILDVPVLSHCCIYWNACFRTFSRHPRFHLTWWSTSYKLRVASYKLPVVNGKFKSMDRVSKVRVEIHEFKFTSYELKFFCHEFKSTSFKFKFTSYKF